MALQTTIARNNLANAYASAAQYAALYSTTPGAGSGTELSGGSPGYARKALTWSGANNGTVTATATFDVGSGATVNGVGVHTSATGGTYLDGGAVATQPFATQGTYTVTLTLTVS